MFSSTDQMASKFFHSIKNNAGVSVILSPFFLHTSPFSQKDKGEEKMVSLNFSLHFNQLKKPLNGLKLLTPKNPLSS